MHWGREGLSTPTRSQDEHAVGVGEKLRQTRRWVSRDSRDCSMRVADFRGATTIILVVSVTSSSRDTADNAEHRTHEWIRCLRFLASSWSPGDIGVADAPGIEPRWNSQSSCGLDATARGRQHRPSRAGRLYRQCRRYPPSRYWR